MAHGRPGSHEANLAPRTHRDKAHSGRRTRYGRLLAALPALLTGMACCVPTVLTVLGTGTAAVLLTVLLPLRAVFYPLSLLLLIATVVWGARFSATRRV